MLDCPEPSLIEPERKRAAVCCGCGMNILVGELALQVDEGHIHRDKECMLDYASRFMGQQELLQYFDFQEVVL